MAEDLRHGGPADGDLKAALLREAAREEENCLYTSTNFYIWLRFLRVGRALLWTAGVICAAVAASHIIKGSDEYKALAAGAAIGAVIFPGLVRALRLDKTVRAYSKAAAAFKNLQDEFRRLREVWSAKPVDELETEAKKLFRAMADARKPSLTPPEFCFRWARRKIKKGHYDFAVDSMPARSERQLPAEPTPRGS